MDERFCVDYLEEALQQEGTPEIFNTDQGSQFTGSAFTGVLKARDNPLHAGSGSASDPLHE